MRFRWRPSTRPPGLARALLAWTTRPADRPFVLSDLQEEYEDRVAREGTTAAREWYRRQARLSWLPSLQHRFLSRSTLSRSTLSRSSPSLGWNAAVEPLPPSGDSPMADFVRDLRYAFRSLAKSPVVVLVTVLSLTVGIGVAATLFSVANALLFRSGGGPAPENLVTVYTSEAENPYGETSFPDLRLVEEQVDAFARVAPFRLGAVELEADGRAERVMVEIVGPEYFNIRHIQASLGRVFAPEEVAYGRAERLTVLSRRLWKDRFGSDPEIVGKTISLEGRPFTVVGVAPEGLRSRILSLEVAAWVPLGVPGGIYNVTPEQLADPAQREFTLLAQLAPGKGIAQARAQLTVLSDRLAVERGEIWLDENDRPRRLAVLSERESRLPPPMRAGLSAVAGLPIVGSALLLLLACSNVAGLFLARVGQRRREMAVRVAVGASRSRLVAMLLVESLLPAVLAGALGLALATWATSRLGAVALPFGFPITFDFGLDYRAVAFAAFLALLSCVAFGLLPALEASRVDLTQGLKAGGRSGAGRSGGVRLRRLLVIGQVTVAAVFVFAAGLAWRTLDAATGTDVGIDPAGIAVTAKTLPSGITEPEAVRGFLRQLRERLQALPEVETVHLALGAEGTFYGSVNSARVRPVDAMSIADGEPQILPYNSVTAGYAETVGLRVARGRTFTETDVAGAPRVALVNETFVRRYWPGESGLGRSFQVSHRTAGGDPVSSGADTYEVVGVVRDGIHAGMDEQPGPYFWTALEQDPSRRILLLVEARAGAEAALDVLRREVPTAEGEVVILAPTTLAGLVDAQYLIPRKVAQLATWGGLFGLGLAMLGIAGLVAFTVSLRRHELAVRQALGARPGRLLRSVVSEGFWLGLWGIAVGTACAVPIARFFDTGHFEISPLDPITQLGGSLVLLTACLLAGWWPARRVTRIDPVKTLRDG